MIPLVEDFHDRGYVTVPRLLDADTVETLVAEMRRLAGTQEAGGTRPNGWTLPDGVTKNQPFWNLVLHPTLLATVRTVLGRDVRFLQHTDLHVGFSSFNWHRDSVSRTLGVGPDWDESAAPYRIVRVGIYLQSAGGGFRLGLVPGTHRLADPRAARARRAIERSASWLGHARRFVTGRVSEMPGAEWIAASAGDAVLFDPRVLHTGTPVDGAKYSVFLAYGVPNTHFEHHARYYRDVRRELGYAAMPDGFVARLRASGLHHDVPVVSEALVGATRPSAIELMAMRRRRAH